jgi:hypothetical protein
MEKFGKSIKKICEPFFIQNGVSYFVYIKITKDGFLTVLNTDPNFSENYLDLGLHNYDIAMIHPDRINTESLILSSTYFPLDEEYTPYGKSLNFAMKYNYDHGLMLFKKKLL